MQAACTDGGRSLRQKGIRGLGQHPNDIPGLLTRAEIWGRVSLGLLIGVSLAVAKTNAEKKRAHG